MSLRCPLCRHAFADSSVKIQGTARNAWRWCWLRALRWGLSMRRVNAPLVLATQDRMAGNQNSILKYPNLMRVVLDLKHAFARRIGYAVIIVRDRNHALMAPPSFHSQNGIVWDRRQRLQAGRLFGKRIINNAQGRRIYICGLAVQSATNQTGHADHRYSGMSARGKSPDGYNGTVAQSCP